MIKSFNKINAKAYLLNIKGTQQNSSDIEGKIFFFLW